jgi:hypothetical protein
MKDHKIIYTTKNSLPSPSPSFELHSSSISSSSPSFLHDSITSLSPASESADPSHHDSSHHHSQQERSIEIEFNSSIDANPLILIHERIITKKDYFLFCFGFSLSVVPIVGVFTFAPVIFSQAGGIGNGVFCIGYTLCSLFYTRKIIQAIGCKSAILWGHFGSGVYIAYYLLCTTTIAFQYSSILYPFGAFVGGVSQSIMWVPPSSPL